MKTADTLKKSISARISDVEAYAMIVANCANDLSTQGFDGNTMSDMRKYLASLTQCVHEYNAYYNTLHTE